MTHFDGEIFVGKDYAQSVKFYRRSLLSVIADGRESKSLTKFLKTVQRQNMAWDEPTRQLFYRDKDGSLYKLHFERIDE